MGRGERKGGRRIPRCLWAALSKMKEVGNGRGEKRSQSKKLAWGRVQIRLSN